MNCLLYKQVYWVYVPNIPKNKFIYCAVTKETPVDVMRHKLYLGYLEGTCTQKQLQYEDI